MKKINPADILISPVGMEVKDDGTQKSTDD